MFSPLFSPCKACMAKDAEIQRLTVQLYALNASLDKQTAEVLELARDATGHSRRASPMDPPFPPLPETVETFLAFRFGHGSPLWRNQVQIARKLVAQGVPDIEVNERISRGKNLDDIV
jgi:hypothetical protein